MLAPGRLHQRAATSLMRLFAGDPEQSEAGPADKARRALTSAGW